MYVHILGLHCPPMTTLDKTTKSRTMNELRQNRDAVYNPLSHDERRLNERLVGAFT